MILDGMKSARRAMRRFFPNSPEQRHLAALLLEIDAFNPTATMAHADSAAFLRGFALLATAAHPDAARFRAFLRRYIGRKHDRDVILLLGRINAPDGELEQVLQTMFMPGKKWEAEFPVILSRYIVDEGEWRRLLDAVNDTLRTDLIYARSNALAVKNRWEFHRAANSSAQGPTAPPLPVGSGLTHADLGFTSASPNYPHAKGGWLSFGLLGWGDIGRPNTRMITARHGRPPWPDKPGTVEGWVRMGQPPRGPAHFAAQRKVVADFIAADPDLRVNFDRANNRYFDPRDPNNQALWRYPDFDGSHLGAHSFGFPTTDKNLIPLSSRMNRSHFAYYEELVRYLYDRHKQVYIRVTVEKYDARGLAEVIRYEAFIPGNPDSTLPVQVLNETMMTNYHPSVTRAQYIRDYEAALRQVAEQEGS